MRGHVANVDLGAQVVSPFGEGSQPAVENAPERAERSEEPCETVPDLRPTCLLLYHFERRIHTD
jgi:hypothetical protein